MHSGTRGIQSTLTQLAAAGGDGAQVAEIAIATLHAIDAALSPIISQRGVAALYKRSVHVTRADYPWLTTAYEGALAATGEFEPLRAALSQQSGPVAAAATAALLRAFHDLLVTLIGGSLTERLLGVIWDDHSSGNAAQDISP